MYYKYLKGIPKANDKRMVDLSEEFNFFNDILHCMLSNTGFLIDIFHCQYFLSRFALNQTNL